MGLMAVKLFRTLKWLWANNTISLQIQRVNLGIYKPGLSAAMQFRNCRRIPAEYVAAQSTDWEAPFAHGR